MRQRCDAAQTRYSCDTGATRVWCCADATQLRHGCDASGDTTHGANKGRRLKKTPQKRATGDPNSRSNSKCPEVNTGSEKANGSGFLTRNDTQRTHAQRWNDIQRAMRTVFPLRHIFTDEKAAGTAPERNATLNATSGHNATLDASHLHQLQETCAAEGHSTPHLDAKPTVSDTLMKVKAPNLPRAKDDTDDSPKTLHERAQKTPHVAQTKTLHEGVQKTPHAAQTRIAAYNNVSSEYSLQIPWAFIPYSSKRYHVVTGSIIYARYTSGDIRQRITRAHTPLTR